MKYTDDSCLSTGFADQARVLMTKGAPLNRLALKPSLDAIRLKQCRTCHKEGAELLKCVTCTAVYYCDKTCQKRDWKADHKMTCASWRCFKIWLTAELDEKEA